MDEIKGKDMTKKYLDRIGIVARIGVIDGEFTKGEILEFISTYGNDKIEGTLDMDDKVFAMLAMMEMLKATADMAKEGGK